MSIFKFVDVNPSQIIAETKAKYESYAGYTLSTADVEMIVIQIMAYREQRVLAKMEDAIHQNFVQLANGEALDYWGEIFGVIRIGNEADDDYRQRILGQSRLAPIGTRAAYISKAKSLADVADCVLQSKQDDITIPPGLIVVTLIQKLVVGSNILGTVASAPVEALVLQAFSDYQLNIIGDMFAFESAIAVPVDGNIVVRKVLGSNSTTVANAVTDVVDAYFRELSLSFSSVFEANELNRRISAVTNIFSIQMIQFINVPVLQRKEFYVKGTVNITVI